jgi:hypothetical protein
MGAWRRGGYFDMSLKEFSTQLRLLGKAYQRYIQI